ncbi:MAG: hypothetical protein DWP97_04585 [Calditrichaeota bacterium]|nr:MAG: hypothetical protein DWP97_04585 [Calditrichota bacterium]
MRKFSIVLMAAVVCMISVSSIFSADIEYICGDLDGTNTIDIADLVYLTAYIFKYDTSPVAPADGDIDGLKGVNIGDLSYLVTYLFEEGEAPDCNAKEFELAVKDSVILESVNGQVNDTLIQIGTPVVFNIRLKNSDMKQNGIMNGFRIYSPDGATWDSTIADTNGTIGEKQFDLIFSNMQTNTDGIDSDTVALSGVRMFGPGMAKDFNEVVYAIKIGPFKSEDIGKTICIDSSYIGPAGDWLWTNANGVQKPSWDGPHCFTISATKSEK